MNKTKIQLTYKHQQNTGNVVERNDYYPLGMRTVTGNSYPQLATNRILRKKMGWVGFR